MTTSSAGGQEGRTEPDYQAERKLPAGRTCADCQHGSRCDALFGAVRRAFTSCDFWPSKFRATGGQEGTEGQGAGIDMIQADRALVANIMGRKDWDDATDYRNTGREDREVERLLKLVQNYRAAIALSRGEA